MRDWYNDKLSYISYRDLINSFLHVNFNEELGKLHLGPNVSSFAHDRVCVVNGSGAKAAIGVLLLLLLLV